MIKLFVLCKKIVFMEKFFPKNSTKFHDDFSFKISKQLWEKYNHIKCTAKSPLFFYFKKISLTGYLQELVQKLRIKISIFFFGKRLVFFLTLFKICHKSQELYFQIFLLEILHHTCYILAQTGRL